MTRQGFPISRGSVNSPRQAIRSPGVADHRLELPVTARIGRRGHEMVILLPMMLPQVLPGQPEDVRLAQTTPMLPEVTVVAFQDPALVCIEGYRVGMPFRCPGFRVGIVDASRCEHTLRLRLWRILHRGSGRSPG